MDIFPLIYSTLAHILEKKEEKNAGKREYPRLNFNEKPQWSAALTVSKCKIYMAVTQGLCANKIQGLLAITSLLQDPWSPPGSPYPSALMFRNDRAKYHATAQEWTRKYAV
jgi:hypothetical protein